MKPDSGTANVAALVRSKIEAGTLPTETPMKVWVGKGTGLTCDACGVPVTSADMKYEIDLPADAPISSAVPYGVARGARQRSDLHLIGSAVRKSATRGVLRALTNLI